MNKSIKFLSRNDREHTLPGKWTICYRCDGDGHVDHPAFSNGITSSKWNEWDDDDRDNYMSGRYDVSCPCCNGSGKMLMVDEDGCVNMRNKILLKEYYRGLKSQHEYEEMCRAERRMGA